MLAIRKRRLLGHIIRSDPLDPLFQVCFDTDGRQHLYETRRVWRPRNHWVRETFKETFNFLEPGGDYVEESDDAILWLFCAAEGRSF